MCKTNFEKWTESPQALLDSMRDLSKYMSLIEMGLVDFEAWAASTSEVPTWKNPRPATYHDTPHKHERQCVLLDSSLVRWDEPYAIVYDDKSQRVLKVPLRNVTPAKIDDPDE